MRAGWVVGVRWLSLCFTATNSAPTAAVCVCVRDFLSPSRSPPFNKWSMYDEWRLSVYARHCVCVRACVLGTALTLDAAFTNWRVWHQQCVRTDSSRRHSGTWQTGLTDVVDWFFFVLFFALQTSQLLCVLFEIIALHCLRIVGCGVSTRSAASDDNCRPVTVQSNHDSLDFPWSEIRRLTTSSDQLTCEPHSYLQIPVSTSLGIETGFCRISHTEFGRLWSKRI